jgi:hypothetical protein
MAMPHLMGMVTVVAVRLLVILAVVLVALVV